MQSKLKDAIHRTQVNKEEVQVIRWLVEVVKALLCNSGEIIVLWVQYSNGK